MRRTAVAVLVSMVAGVLAVAGSAVPASAAVLPDLVISAVSDPPAVGRAGRVVDVSYTIVNDDEGPAAPATTTSVFLSRNTTKGASDRLLGTDEVIALDPGMASVEGPTPMVVPASTPAASYYLIVCANQVSPKATEVTRANNCTTSATTVRVRRADPGAFSGTTSWVFGDGCTFAHQSFEGEFNAIGTLGAGTFVTDGCSETSPVLFTYTGTFTAATDSGPVAGVVTGSISSGTSPTIVLRLFIDGSAERIVLTGRWTNSGEIPSVNDPINGIATQETGDSRTT